MLSVKDSSLAFDYAQATTQNDNHLYIRGNLRNFE